MRRLLAATAAAAISIGAAVAGDPVPERRYTPDFTPQPRLATLLAGAAADLDGVRLDFAYDPLTRRYAADDRALRRLRNDLKALPGALVANELKDLLPEQLLEAAEKLRLRRTYGAWRLDLDPVEARATRGALEIKAEPWKRSLTFSYRHSF